MTEPNRIFEIDALKTLAIITIVVVHAVEMTLHQYPLALSVNVGISVFGLALFFFVSGHSLSMKRPNFNSLNDVKRYLVKRVVRIYPLYWFALAIAEVILILGLDLGAPFILTDFDLVRQLAVLSGLQILFVPQLFEGLKIFWFVSEIMVFYLLFPLMIFISGKIGRSFAVSIIVPAFGIYLFMIILRVFFGLFEVDQLFIYYWIFVAGIISGWLNTIPTIKVFTTFKICLVSGVILGLLYIIKNPMADAFNSLSIMIPNTAIMIAALSFIGIISVSLSIPLINKSKKLFTDYAVRIINLVGSSTYWIYLFHLYFLTFFVRLAMDIYPDGTLLAAFLLGIPCAVVGPIIMKKTIASIISSIDRLSF